MRRLAVILALSGCWHFTAEQPPPAPPPLRPQPRAPVADAAVADAAPDAPALDAGVAGAAPGRRAFPPGDASPCIRARVIAARLTGSDLELTVAGGANAGVTPAWTVTIDDPARTTGRITAVDARVTRFVVSGVTPDHVQAHPVVQLCP